MTHLINGLLEYSRDHNQPEKHFKSILLTELENELKSMLLYDKTCSIEFTSTLSEIQSHPILLTQVLTNLVSNASGTLSWNNQLYNSTNVKVVSNHPSPGEYSTIAAAVAACTGSSQMNPYLVRELGLKRRETVWSLSSVGAVS